MKCRDPLSPSFSHVFIYSRSCLDVLNPSQIPDFVFRKETWERLPGLAAAGQSSLLPSDVISMESGCITLYSF